jgi:hypothetical protein
MKRKEELKALFSHPAASEKQDNTGNESTQVPPPARQSP